MGVDPDGGEIVAANGRYGPYLSRGEETRSIDAEEKLLTISVDEAARCWPSPSSRSGRRAGAPAARARTRPGVGPAVVVKDGRFGPYVTDGETNASLRKGDTVEGVTIERAAELLQIRRDAGPTKKRGAKKTAAKKTAAKKAPAKKAAAKKAPARKVTRGHGQEGTGEDGRGEVSGGWYRGGDRGAGSGR